MKKYILIAIGVILIMAALWLLIGAEAWAEMSGIHYKVFQCAGILAMWSALILFIASHEKEPCHQDID